MNGASFEIVIKRINENSLNIAITTLSGLLTSDEELSELLHAKYIYNQILHSVENNLDDDNKYVFLKDIKATLRRLAYNHLIECNEQMFGVLRYYRRRFENNDLTEHQRLFYEIMTQPATQQKAKEISQILSSNNETWRYKAYILGATLINAFHMYSPEYTTLLIDNTSHSDPRIAARAYTGVLLTLSTQYDAIYGDCDVWLSLQEFMSNNTARDMLTETVKAVYKEIISILRKEEINELHLKLTSRNNKKEDMEALRKVKSLHEDLLDIKFDNFRSLLPLIPEFREIDFWIEPFDFSSLIALDPNSKEAKTLFAIANELSMSETDKKSMLSFMMKNLKLTMDTLGNTLEAEQIAQFESKEVVHSLNDNILLFCRDMFRMFTCYRSHGEMTHYEKMLTGFINSDNLFNLINNADSLIDIADTIRKYDLNDECLKMSMFVHDNLCPNNTKNLLNISKHYLKTKNYASALYYAQIIELQNEDDTNAKVIVAESLLNLNRYESAAERYYTLMKQHPETISYALQYINCLITLNRTQDALPIAFELYYKHSESDPCIYTLCETLLFLNRHDEALSHISESNNIYDITKIKAVIYAMRNDINMLTNTLRNFSAEKINIFVKYEIIEDIKETLIELGMNDRNISLILDSAYANWNRNQ